MTGRDQQRAAALIGWIAGELLTPEATALLGVSERQAWRLRRRFLAEGPAALVHGNRGRAIAEPDRRGRPSARSSSWPGRRYDGANDCHLAELLAEREGIHLGRVTVRRILRAAGRPSPRRQRPPATAAAASGCPRRGCCSSSTAAATTGWRAGARGSPSSAPSTMPPAGSFGTFRDEEDSAGYLEFCATRVREPRHPGRSTATATASSRRAPGSAWAPRRPRRDRTATQVGAASRSSASARSPPAAPRPRVGSSEAGAPSRTGSSPLRLAGASDRASANRVLAAFLPALQRPLRGPPADPEPAWRAVPEGVDLDAVFAFRYRRVVANDHTVRIGGLALELPPPARPARLCRPAGRGRGPARWAHRRHRSGRLLLASEPILDAGRLREPRDRAGQPRATRPGHDRDRPGRLSSKRRPSLATGGSRAQGAAAGTGRADDCTDQVT